MSWASISAHSYQLLHPNLVPPPGYDPGSSDFQSVAMTTSAKEANWWVGVRVELTLRGIYIPVSNQLKYPNPWGEVRGSNP